VDLEQIRCRSVALGPEHLLQALPMNAGLLVQCWAADGCVDEVAENLTAQIALAASSASITLRSNPRRNSRRFAPRVCTVSLKSRDKAILQSNIHCTVQIDV
jgi:hypothetical protein